MSARRARRLGSPVKPGYDKMGGTGGSQWRRESAVECVKSLSRPALDGPPRSASRIDSFAAWTRGPLGSPVKPGYDKLGVRSHVPRRAMTNLWRVEGGFQSGKPHSAWSVLQALVQVVPVRIDGLDQFQLPPALPFFQARLAVNGESDVVKLFIIHQHFHGILPRESGDQALAMLPNPPGEIVRDANIERSVPLAGEDLHEVCLCQLKNPLPPDSSGRPCREACPPAALRAAG
jgi:hypothetical protein